jgi:hypothetical protein
VGAGARRAKAFPRAGELGAELAGAIKEKRGFPEQEAERRAFFERMKNLVDFRQARWPYEFQYWKSKEWM